MKIRSEIGADLCHFRSVKDYRSWLGLFPAAKTSGGKVLSARSRRSANRVRRALMRAAMSLAHSESAVMVFYRSPCTHMDKPRANTATGLGLEVNPQGVSARPRRSSDPLLASPWQPGEIPSAIVSVRPFARPVQKLLAAASRDESHVFDATL